ncbi:hypothetical protein B0O99DRAFT_689521 [Bisporella sp. PMI_857]|nr:hypothetical protein B0O99DRAFT_689521 [Bisporella sp. PMI_857]
MLKDPVITILGRDPSHRVKILNGNSFQQDVLVTFGEWQYAAWYGNEAPGAEPLYVHVGRRCLTSREWEIVVLDDYEQRTDDPHNTVQLGICHGDGTIHLSYDHHCDQLRYRHSVKGLALKPDEFQWNKDQFTPNLSFLPGLPKDLDALTYLTYPRFVVLDNDMLFSARNGKAGLGSDHLFYYHSDTGNFTSLGIPLVGVQNNPYINRIDYRNGRIHITWVYRGFIWYEGWDDPLDTKHKTHAGPNGAENNYDLCYIYSDDRGLTWKNGDGETIGSLAEGVHPESKGIVGLYIPKNSGLTNQDGQAVDYDGGVHALNRDSLSENGRLRTHLYRSPEGKWSSRYIPHVGEPRYCDRGCMAVSKIGDLFIVIPDGPNGSILTIIKATKKGKYEDYKVVWRKDGFPTEPLLDVEGLEKNGVLSIFSITPKEGGKEGNVVVLDFDVSSE